MDKARLAYLVDPEYILYRIKPLRGSMGDRAYNELVQIVRTAPEASHLIFSGGFKQYETRVNLSFGGVVSADDEDEARMKMAAFINSGPREIPYIAPAMVQVRLLPEMSKEDKEEE